jgi:hypothetical protein
MIKFVLRCLKGEQHMQEKEIMVEQLVCVGACARMYKRTVSLYKQLF